MRSKALLLGSLVVGIMSAGCAVAYEAEEGEVGDAQQAYVSRAWAYAWAHQATGSYTASSSYSRNSAGDNFAEGLDNTVSQLETGRYRVRFPDVGTAPGGHVQVTAYGGGSERCKVNSWLRSGDDVDVYVNCFTAGGAPVDTKFSVAYVRKSGTGSSGEAYVWANNATAAAYTPDPMYQFNSSGASNTIARQGVGYYAVTLPGQTALGGTVEVTAYGAGSDHCKVSSWGQSGGDTVVRVRCFDSAGAPSDGRFTLNFARSRQVNGGLSYSYAWANNPTAASYTPSLSYQEGYIAGDLGDVGIDITAARTSAGRYSVSLPGMSATGSNVQVTAYGSGPEYCKVVGWGGSETTANVNVACFDESGAPADSRFVLVYTDDKFIVL
ncbi:hypothetical protein WMF31_02980 [Sorangium sp. So ce1036]|uniref:hypothetical protein n=1 Tax=Sorangium sp. So ce1036 TaxID=3133328 RepID=UPI003F06B6B2